MATGHFHAFTDLNQTAMGKVRNKGSHREKRHVVAWTGNGSGWYSLIEHPENSRQNTAEGLVRGRRSAFTASRVRVEATLEFVRGPRVG